MAAVPAGVRERADLPVLAADEQRAAAAGVDRELVAGRGSRELWAAHVQPPPKKCRRSQSNTSADVYAAGGSIRLSPNGSSAVASAAGSTGAGGKARGDPFIGPVKS